MILHPHGLKQRLTITETQIAAILGLENLLHASGLILICPNCLADGDPFLTTENTPTASEWKIDCGCRERRILRTAVPDPMDADGNLMAAAEAILAPLRLSVRCPERRCIASPLEIERTPDTVIVRCHCAKTTLRPPTRH